MVPGCLSIIRQNQAFKGLFARVLPYVKSELRGPVAISPLAWGARGPEFKSRRPDQLHTDFLRLVETSRPEPRSSCHSTERGSPCALSFVIDRPRSRPPLVSPRSRRRGWPSLRKFQSRLPPRLPIPRGPRRTAIA